MDVARTHSPQPLSLHQNVALRTGVYAGLGLSLILVVWIFLANRVAIPKEFVRERNLATVALLVAVRAGAGCTILAAAGETLDFQPDGLDRFQHHLCATGAGVRRAEQSLHRVSKCLCLARWLI